MHKSTLNLLLVFFFFTESKSQIFKLLCPTFLQNTSTVCSETPGLRYARFLFSINVDITTLVLIIKLSSTTSGYILHRTRDGHQL